MRIHEISLEADCECGSALYTEWASYPVSRP